jgi:hypothetical protein
MKQLEKIMVRAAEPGCGKCTQTTLGECNTLYQGRWTHCALCEKVSCSDQICTRPVGIKSFYAPLLVLAVIMRLQP